MISRFRHKLARVRRYPALADSPRDRRDLLLLGLWRERLLGAGTAGRLSTTGRAAIAPRLRATRGEAVGVTIGDFSEMDCFDEIFTDPVYDLDRVPFAPDLVVDCGAFHGYFTALAAGRFRDARIVAFEPNPEHRDALQAQAARLSRPVELQFAAAGRSSGRARFAGHGMGGSLGGAAADPGWEVEVVDFPAWLSSQAPRRLVWKLDVEGAERELLPATLPRLPASAAIFLETHFDTAETDRILAAARAAGFAAEMVRRRDAGVIAYIEWLLLRP